MKRSESRTGGKITISDNGIVHIPTTVSMRDFEIAQLLGVFQQTVKANIRAILKSGVSCGDSSKGATVVGNSVVPDYFGLDMVIVLAFRVHSPKARILRNWIIKKALQKSEHQTPIIIQCGDNLFLS